MKLRHEMYARIHFIDRIYSFLLIIRWNVHVRVNDENHEKVETFDYVLVCTGPYRKPKTPTVPGIETFKGKVMHMHQYRTRETFIGKKVVVVGVYCRVVQDN